MHKPESARGGLHSPIHLKAAIDGVLRSVDGRGCAHFEDLKDAMLRKNAYTRSQQSTGFRAYTRKLLTQTRPW